MSIAGKMRAARLWIGRAGILFAIFAGGTHPAALALSDDANQQVNVVVPSIISISSATTQMTLTFADYVQGSESNSQVVNYSVRGNNLQKTTGVVQGSLSALFTDIDFTADVGAYNKTLGNASLTPSNGSPVVIGAVNTNLCNRVIDAGNGKITQGDFDITYKAVATNTLAGGTEQRTLTITFTDT